MPRPTVFTSCDVWKTDRSNCLILNHRNGTPVQPLRLVIISGLSGSGKTHAIKCFEDLGFFCVDNLPPALLPKFAELCLQRERDVQDVALGIDIRERGFFSDFFRNLE